MCYTSITSILYPNFIIIVIERLLHDMVMKTLTPLIELRLSFYLQIQHGVYWSFPKKQKKLFSNLKQKEQIELLIIYWKQKYVGN